ncbi:hypothetical protein [Pigmentiphaga sp.]|uniref:hypothetical protein n=1 Tax=Pigmentiphaga sp. TaxID=1977564 RepID=UPI0025FAA5CC|nr:hypothetical protein [Pigmentiphaga sp.]
MERTTYSVPMLVPAPGLYSMMMDWPSVVLMCSLIARANTSEEPPAEPPMMMRMGRDG